MLKLVFEWCRIHIKTVLALHYSLVVFYPILLWFTYAWFIQANPVQVGPGPPKSAQVNPNSQVLPGPPRFSQEICDFLRFCGFPGFPGRTWVLFSAILWGFRDILGEPGWKQLGMGLGELQELVRGKVAGGWPTILTRNF